MDRIIIAGAGTAGLNLMERLDNTTLIESDPAKFTILSRGFPNLRIVGGDATQPETLVRAGIESCSALVILTNKDYVNWKIVLAAREFPVPRIVARLRDENYRQKYLDAGVMHIISPTEETVLAVQRLVFPSHETMTDIPITAESPVIGRPISDIQLPANNLVAAVRRGQRLLRPSSEIRLRNGDVLSLISLGELDVNVYEILAGAKSPYIPRSAVIFLWLSAEDSDALGEVAYLCSRFRSSCEIVFGGEGRELAETAKLIMEKTGVGYTLKHLNGNIFSGFIHHVSNIKADAGVIVAVHQAKKGMFRYRLPLKFVSTLIKSTHAGIMIVRGNRYERVLHLLDSSAINNRCTRCSVSMAMDTSAKLYALCPHLSGSVEHDLVRTHTRRIAKIYGLDVIEDIVVGDPTIEFVQKVRARPDQLVIINWVNSMISRDILSRIVNDSEASILVVGGERGSRPRSEKDSAGLGTG